MSRIPAIDPTTAAAEARELLAGVQKSLGATPNLYRVIAQSPRALEGVLGLTGALARGRIGPRLREQIALAVAEANACDYCRFTNYLNHVARTRQPDSTRLRPVYGKISSKSARRGPRDSSWRPRVA